ncbi:MAG: hypothetical protein JWL65_6786 [Gammaproteobacteria bacterium]|nr:hypothetical protein [Gammaproteobacteria bacterium]
MSQSFGGGIYMLFCRRHSNFSTLAPTHRRMNRPFKLGGRRMNGFGQGNRLMAHFERLERTRVSFHTAAHIALTGMVRNAPAEMDLNESHPILVAIQRPLDHSLDSKRQLLAAIDVLVGMDPNLHLGSA